jgi:Uma2 family endonuclease
MVLEGYNIRMTLADLEYPVTPTPHRWTVDEFLRASEAGVFESRRVQLIEGELIDMPAQKDPHAWAVSRLVHALRVVFPDPYWIKIEATVRLNDYSGPEPDAAVMSGPPSPPAAEAPTPLLFVEVSDSTLRYDRGDKASHYAANGIADYWVADVVGQRVEVFREPVRDPSQRYGWGYAKSTVHALGDHVTALAKPDAMIAVAAFLG